jgi:hypothetical protein
MVLLFAFGSLVSSFKQSLPSVLAPGIFHKGFEELELRVGLHRPSQKPMILENEGVVGRLAGIPPGKDSPAYSGLLSTHAEALGSTEKIKRQPTLKSRSSSKDLSSRKKMHVPAREGTKHRHASMREN